MRVRVFAIVAVGALQSPALADATDDAALLHLDRGIAAFEAKDFATAAHELSIAHELAPTKANPYRWLALTEIQLGDCTSALPHIEGFLARVTADDARIPEMTRWREFCTRSNEPLPPAKPVEKPMHARWWFWPVVGTAALAVTGATVYVVTHGDESTLPPVRFP